MILSHARGVLGYGGRCMKDESGSIRNRSFLVRGNYPVQSLRVLTQEVFDQSMMRLDRISNLSSIESSLSN